MSCCRQRHVVALWVQAQDFSWRPQNGRPHCTPVGLEVLFTNSSLIACISPLEMDGELLTKTAWTLEYSHGSYKKGI